MSVRGQRSSGCPPVCCTGADPQEEHHSSSTSSDEVTCLCGMAWTCKLHQEKPILEKHTASH